MKVGRPIHLDRDGPSSDGVIGRQRAVVHPQLIVAGRHMPEHIPAILTGQGGVLPKVQEYAVHRPPHDVCDKAVDICSAGGGMNVEPLLDHDFEAPLFRLEPDPLVRGTFPYSTISVRFRPTSRRRRKRC